MEAQAQEVIQAYGEAWPAEAWDAYVQAAVEAYLPVARAVVAEQDASQAQGGGAGTGGGQPECVFGGAAATHSRSAGTACNGTGKCAGDNPGARRGTGAAGYGRTDGTAAV